MRRFAALATSSLCVTTTNVVQRLRGDLPQHGEHVGAEPAVSRLPVGLVGQHAGFGR